MSDPKWVEWAQKLQAIAQTGLNYSQIPYDIDRYNKLRDVAFEIMSTYAQTEMPVIRGLYDQQSGYATPKVSVRGVIFKDDKILMVKELADGGRWTLPGGWADVNDSPSHAIEREVWEESGYKVKAVKLMAVLDNRNHGHPPFAFHHYNLFFLCEILGGEPATSFETGGVGFFAEHELPELSISRVTPKELAMLFYQHTHPDSPASFD